MKYYIKIDISEYTGISRLMECPNLPTARIGLNLITEQKIVEVNGFNSIVSFKKAFMNQELELDYDLKIIYPNSIQFIKEA